MCNLAILAALLAATVPGASPEGASVADARYQCWSAWRAEVDDELVVTTADVPVLDHVAPDADPVETDRFSGIGWTFGNLFDDVEDTGSPLGPGDYSNLDLNSITDVDGFSLAVSV